MADVDMPDASPPGPSKARVSVGAKAAKSGSSADAGSDNKKRFEVKKVRWEDPEQDLPLAKKMYFSGTL